MTRLHSGQIIGGKYRLDQPLARGGMGSVWRAYHAQIGTPFALKFMAKTLLDSESARARFEREARATALLRSPYVVQVLDFGIEDEVPYLVMELFEGEDLSSRLKRVCKMRPAELWPIVAQIAKGLQKAHDAGIVHRDLKPRNIFIAATDEGEVLKILDFGVAKISGELGHTTTGELVGSPQYMSPEQAKGERNIDQRSDLWSLAAIVYRALTGELAFSGDGVGDIIMKIALEKPVPPTQIAPELSPDVDRFFDKAFARDREQRFQSVQEFARAFSALAGGEELWAAGGAHSRRAFGAGFGPVSIAGGPSAADAGPASYSLTPAPVHASVSGEQAQVSRLGSVSLPRKRGPGLAIALVLSGLGVGAGAFMLFSKRGAASSHEPALSSSPQISELYAPKAAESGPGPAQPTAASSSPPAASASAAAATAPKTAPARRLEKAAPADKASATPQPPPPNPENPDLGY